MQDIRWTPGIGDPSFVGWLTVFAYFAVAWICLRAFMAEKAGPSRPYIASILALVRVFRHHWPEVPGPARRAFLWLLLAGTMTALGINKQLDLQSLFTDIGRIVAHSQGWYDSRRIVQALFILVLLTAAIFGISAFHKLTKGYLADYRLALTGVILLLSFILIRASSFHHVDILLSLDLGGLRINWILELSGIGMIGLGAHFRIRKVRH